MDHLFGVVDQAAHPVVIRFAELDDPPVLDQPHPVHQVSPRLLVIVESAERVWPRRSDENRVPVFGHVFHVGGKVTAAENVLSDTPWRHDGRENVRNVRKEFVGRAEGLNGPQTSLVQFTRDLRVGDRPPHNRTAREKFVPGQWTKPGLIDGGLSHHHHAQAIARDKPSRLRDRISHGVGGDSSAAHCVGFRHELVAAKGQIARQTSQVGKERFL